MKTIKYLGILACIISMNVRPVWAASDNKGGEAPGTDEENLAPITLNIGVLISTLSTNGWRQTAIPTEWKGSVFDEIILLDDATVKLREAGMGAIADTVRLKALLANPLRVRLKDLAARNNRVTLNVVLMGHSVLGGYVARILASTPDVFGLDNIINSVTNGRVTVKLACVTVATPHQGISLSAISVEPRPGFRNIAPTLVSFKEELTAGLHEDVTVGPLRWVFLALGVLGLGTVLTLVLGIPIPKALLMTFVVALPTVLIVTNRLEQDISGHLKEVSVDYIEPAFMTAQVIIGNKAEALVAQNVSDITEYDFDYVLKELLKPDQGDGDQGLIIEAINALPDPTLYRNVFGAEKHPVPGRFMSEIIDVDYVLRVRVLGTLVDLRNERGFAKTFDNAQRLTGLQKDWWWTKHQTTYVACKIIPRPFRGGCNDKKDRHKRRSRNWGRTETALDNIDITWGKIINANKYKQKTMYQRIYDPSVCEDDRIGELTPAFYRLATVENINSRFEEGEIM